MRSLGSKLWLAMALVALIGVGTVAVAVGRSVAVEFTVYARRGMQVRAAALAPVLESYYAKEGGWDGVGVLLADLAASGDGQGGTPGRGRGANGAVEQRLILLTVDGRVAADSAGLWVGRVLPEESRQGVLLDVNGVQVGMLLSLDVLPSGVASAEEQFLAAVRRALSYAGVAVFLASLAISTLLARQLVAPIQRLTRAAETMLKDGHWTEVAVGSRDEVGELTQVLNTMATTIEAGEQHRRHMTADIAHELRNPLSVLRSNVEAMLDDVYPTDKEHLLPVLEETLLLQRLVDDLRLLSLAESGHLTLQRELVEVPDLLKAVAEVHQAGAHERGIELLVEVQGALPKVHADPDRLRQIVGNLLDNALRYTQAGGVITLRAGGGSEGVRIEVEDSGAGIPKEDVARVFDRFYRGDAGRSRSWGGSGLGLSIVRALVEAHGGVISVNSELGKGATFVIDL